MTEANTQSFSKSPLINKAYSIFQKMNPELSMYGHLFILAILCSVFCITGILIGSNFFLEMMGLRILCLAFLFTTPILLMHSICYIHDMFVIRSAPALKIFSGLIANALLYWLMTLVIWAVTYGIIFLRVALLG